ncbi:DNA primase small subunit [Gracilariopsis chorda]|uniref:DNA primase n=1 Tax=Gracilariopsis chorda TaxID=448386 RepID=A0A2V3J595_9FLOR|nr:DNA primase small subunit [Gracilariopsis chorda]|eukprot:PXF49292.1 DNA primase small subunit [Gracilariopsis chorda]
MPAPNAAPTSAAALQRADLPAKLRWYYARLFPIELITRWLRYGSDSTLAHREISFTLAGDIYLRWKSFGDKAAFLEELHAKRPVKIDIGAVYNNEPCKKHSIGAPFTPSQKELVFDIDMTDYEDVMAAATANMSPTDVCDNNWEYMAAAVEVIDTALREDFGFKIIMWVYSGRRGVHCWVADQRARFMSNEQRSAVADFLHVRFEGRENRGRRQMEVTHPMHPSLRRARTICEPVFRKMLRKQALLDGEKAICDMLELISNAVVRAEIREKVVRMRGDADEVWERIEKEVGKAARNEFGMRAMADYMVLRYTYPRLDVNVSREMNHLLKAPFCVHPKTGRVCVPFRAAEAARFRPGEMAPVLDGLLNEIDGGGGGEMSAKLEEGVRVLEEFVKGCEMEVREKARLNKLDQVDRRNVMELMKD